MPGLCPAQRPQNHQNRCKDLLDEQSSTTQARVTLDNSTFCFANTEFFSVLLATPACKEAQHKDAFLTVA